MAFQDIVGLLKKRLPLGTSDRFVKLEALERMLAGTFYGHIPYPFEQEKRNGKHLPMRERRPSDPYNAAYLITADTQAELFGDEQFPSIQCSSKGNVNEDATEAYAELLRLVDLPQVMADVYEEGVVGSVGVVLHRTDDGSNAPFFDVLPGKWCEPVYFSEISSKLIGLIVTLPIKRKEVEAKFPEILKLDRNKATEIFWYRYIVQQNEIVDFWPLSDVEYESLGEKRPDGTAIEFEEHKRWSHGFGARVPAVYIKNLGGRRRELDGMALWWPVVDIIIDLDYTLSQCSRGFRYTADPMLFLKSGDLNSLLDDDLPVGMSLAQKAVASAGTAFGENGEFVRGASQVISGRGPDSDAKILEISAGGLREEREFAKDLRELLIEILGGMKARADHLGHASSGKSIDKGLKPLRRLVRRQRRPYGAGLLELASLTLYGVQTGILYVENFDATAIPATGARADLDWPNDETLQGQELLYHAQACQLMEGGSLINPKEILSPDAVGAKLAADVGFHEPYAAIKGSGDLQTPPAPPGATLARP